MRVSNTPFPESVENHPEFRNLGESLIYKNPVFRLMNVTFESPTGERFDRQVVRHPGAVAVLPLHDDGTVTLVSQFRGSIGRNLIEIPAGLLDIPGEDLASAAGRELHEEVGLVAADLRLLTTYHAAVGFADEAITVFVGTGLTEIGNDLKGPEEAFLRVLRIPMEQALDMVKRGEITDGKTVISLLLSRM
jgi:8-oxo-dGTP pyrophosphatase MutT (NUDIX family)